jgi:MFS family permease
LISILSWREVIPPDSFFEKKEVKQNSFSNVLKDKNFVNYLIWRGSLVILEIATPFYTLSALDQLSVGAAQVGIFTTILAFSEAALNPLWGWLGDKKGFLRIIQIAALAGIGGAVLAMAAPTLLSYYAIFFLVGAMIGGLQISTLNIIFEFSPNQLVPLYTAVSQIALTPLSSFVPLLGGFISERFGFVTDYWLAAGLGLVSFIGLTLSVKNPKRNKKVPVQEVRALK